MTPGYDKIQRMARHFSHANMSGLEQLNVCELEACFDACIASDWDMFVDELSDEEIGELTSDDGPTGYQSGSPGYKAAIEKVANMINERRKGES